MNDFSHSGEELVLLDQQKITGHADGSDVTRVVFRMEEQAGNLLPYLYDFLKLSIQGPGEIIGPHEIPLIGGTVAVWIKPQMTAGAITLSAASTHLNTNDVMIKTSM